MALLPAKTTISLDTKAFRRALLDWYSEHQRDLPWRRSHDPYQIWISEIMLQQTRVETVLPYFQRFCDRYPTVVALANADETELTGLWAGLGYYSRARNLQRAAQILMEKYGGDLPRTIDELESLPGIGKYTAAAIASIAFGANVAAVDGNLERVLSRVLALQEAAKGSPLIHLTANALAAPGNAAEVNQGLMDLANKICRAKNPDCLLCPLANLCRARKEGLVNKIPVRPPKRAKVELSAYGLALIRSAPNRAAEVLLVKRPPKTWLAGMWDLPWWIHGAQESLRTLRFPKLGQSSLTRTITHHKVRFTVDGFSVPAKAIRSNELRRIIQTAGQEYRWLTVESALQELPKPSRKSLLAVIHGEFRSTSGN